MTNFGGVLPALVTAFNRNGEIDAKAMERLVKFNLEKGVTGFYVGGSTAESFMLSPEERKYALEIVMDAVEGKADIIANIGFFSTQQGIDLAKHAEKLGVSAISSVPPFYFKFNMEEYYAYYSDILEEVQLPMLIYNVPAMSGVNFTEQDFDRFFQHERIMGVKYTSYDLFLMQKLIQNHPTKTVFIGHDEIY
ncbi:dihydrodipicolinate synthase family protein, partial [Ruminococcaceae bacterium OttesenSCG-928-D13]|nr:dihydrodipicolinate synthase family protein [Ruminococcaceae bacterium OttesenSCG-928-D13]